MTREQRSRRAAFAAVNAVAPQMGEAFLDKPRPPSATTAPPAPQADEAPETLPQVSRSAHYS